MNARYTNINHFNHMVATYEWLNKRFRNNEFTTKEFNEAKKQHKGNTYNTLARLRVAGIVKVTRVEKFSKEIENKSGEVETIEVERFYYTINPNGMKKWRDDYSHSLIERADKMTVKIAGLIAKRDALMAACQS